MRAAIIMSALLTGLFTMASTVPGAQTALQKNLLNYGMNARMTQNAYQDNMAITQ